MLFVGAIFLMLLALSVLIIVHEMGHYSVARFFGFQTPVFGFGLPFGPYWVVGSKWGTQFRIHACLLGGYVAIPELGDETAVQEEAYGVPLQPFKKFAIWKRALVAFAGPGFNILFAWLVMWVIVNTFGDPTHKVIVAELPPDNPIAARAGVQAGDQVLSIDKTRIDSTDDIIFYLGKRPETPVTLHVLRAGKQVDLPMTTNNRGKVGMALDNEGPTIYRKLDMNPIETVGFATQKLEKLTGQMLEGMGMLFDGIIHPAPKNAPPGQHRFGLKDLHGVLAVVKIGADIASQDWSQVPLFVVMISMDLAIINLVPWPGLDGSHLAFMLFEAIRGKPMEEKAHGTIVQWGFMSLLVLMAVIMYNDIEALVTGKLDINLKNKPGHASPAPSGNGSANTTPDKTNTDSGGVTPGSNAGGGTSDATSGSSTAAPTGK